MFTSFTFFNNQNLNLDTLTYNFSQSLPLDENDDSNNDFNSENSKDKSQKIFNISKKERRRKGDDIRKKVKSNSHKSIRLDLNEKLIKAGSKYTFESFPQHFIADIKQKTNNEAMQLTYLELFEYTYKNLINDKNYFKRNYNKNYIEAAINKYYKNKITLAYLDSNPEISKKSGWEKIKNTKYVDLLKEYFVSKEFEQFVSELSKTEDEEYIKAYKYFSKTYTEFFLNYKNNEKFRNNSTEHINNNNNSNSSENIIINNIDQNPNPNNIINNCKLFSLEPNNNDTNEEKYLDSLIMSPFLFHEESDQSENLYPDIDGYLKDENSLFSEENFMFRRFW